MNVLFVCLGNICRSPLAAGIMKAIYVERSIRGVVESAGTEDWHVGKRADARSIKVAAEAGIDISDHCVRQICGDDFIKFDVIYAMDRDNERAIQAVAPEGLEMKVRRIRNAPADSCEADVPDPYEGNEKHFRQVFSILHERCDDVAGEIMPGVLFTDLSEETLEPACELLRQVFPRQGLLHNSDLALRFSLKPDAFVSRLAFKVAGVLAPRYWVAIERSSDTVIGIIGVYEELEDCHEALWGGWSCVAPAWRNKGLGRAMFQFVVDYARRAQKKYCRVYGSTNPSQSVAQMLFDSFGSRITKTTPYLFSPHLKVYRELPL